MTNRFKAIAGITGIFLLGGICGALLFGLIIRDNVREREKLRDHDGFISYFERRLELTEAQRDSLRDELEFAYNRLADLREATSAEYNAVIDTMSQRIYPQLTPEQRELFKQQEQKLRRMIPKEHTPRVAAHGPGGPPPSRPPLPGASQVESHPSAAAGAGTTERAEERPTARGEKPADASPRMATIPATPKDSSGAAQTSEPDNLRDAMNQIKQMLDLSNDQVTKIDGLITETKARNRRARSELADSPGLLIMTLRTNNRDMRRNVFALLTPEQRQKFEQIRQSRQKSR